MKVVRIGTTALVALAVTALGMPGATAGSQSLVTKVTIGRHAHFDRIVIRETRRRRSTGCATPSTSSLTGAATRWR